MIDKKKIGWKFDNSYLTLDEMFFSKIKLDPVALPQLVCLNEKLAEELGIDSIALESDAGIAVLAGNHMASRGSYIAQAYAGHQFGHFTMLGDGRAVLIGEHIAPDSKRYDIQLKGSGRTSYSRSGDGRAVLGPMLREYIISEAMYGLGIPTTRSLAVVKTGEAVQRQRIEEGAILTRVAASHIRVGTFQYAYYYGGEEKVRELADYSMKRHYPWIKEGENKYLEFLQEVIKVQAKLIAKWQSVGFIHGVINTDNMTISGETIDYGPCAFMDHYDPLTVFSSIDRDGRYCYKNQPIMVHWNLCRFAETLIPLIDKDKEKSIEMAQEIIAEFPKLYSENWMALMRGKLGIFNIEDKDEVIVAELLDLMDEYKEDYTNTFLALTFDEKPDGDMFKSSAFKKWHERWQERLQRQKESKIAVVEKMKKSNPAMIPRNHRVEEVIEAANQGNFEKITRFVNLLLRPYEHSKEQEIYRSTSPLSNIPYRTFCGT